MIRFKIYIFTFTFVLTSCSNFLTWHLDKGIHKDSSITVSETPTTKDASSDSIVIDSPDVQRLGNMKERGIITQSEYDLQIEKFKKKYFRKPNIKTEVIWSTSTNDGIEGNSAYLEMRKEKNKIYSIDTEGLISAVNAKNGDILWQVPTNHAISSGLSLLDDDICVGTMNAELLCYKIDSLSSHNHLPLITSIKNSTTYSEYDADISIDLITELASPISKINNLLLLKLDNDDLYLLDPKSKEVIWKSESQNIPLRSKGSSSPLIFNNSVFIARDNGSVSSYNEINGTLQWFTIISSRSGRNDLESQRDAEMNIIVEKNIIYYGHYQGNLTSLDIFTGDIIWSSPFSFINNIIINNNSIFGSTSNNLLVSLDQASGFLNWKSPVNRNITEPFIIDDIVMTFSTDGVLFGYDKENGIKVYEKDFGFDLHPQTQYIVEKNTIYFQTIDGDTISIKISI